MERNRTNNVVRLKLKLVLSVVLVCLVGSTSTKNKTQVRGHALGIPPVEDRSLVAMVKDGQQRAVRSSSDPNAVSDGTVDTHNGDASARRKLSSEEGESAVSNDGETTSPLSSKAKLKWIFGADRPNLKKISPAERLHLFTNGQVTEQARTLKFRQRDVVFSEQGERSFVDLLLGRNVRGVATNNLSEKRKPGMRRREISPGTSSEPDTVNVTRFDPIQAINQTVQSRNDSDNESANQDASLTTSSETDETPTVRPTPHASTEAPAPPVTNPSLLSTIKPDTPPAVVSSSPVWSPPSEIPESVLPSSPFPDTTSTQRTSEPTAPVTSPPIFSSTAPTNKETSTAYPEVSQPSEPPAETSKKQLEPSVKATPKIATTLTPSSAPKHSTADYRTTSPSDSGSPSQRNGTGLLPATNSSILLGSKIQDVQERTSGSECANSNCNPALVPANQWTDDAYWAFGSLLTILLLLTAAVLYTGLWRKRNHMSNPISDVNCHALASPSRKGKTDIKDFLKKKLRHIKSLNSSPLSSSGKSHASKHNGITSNGRAGNGHPHRYDRLPLLVGDEEEEEFSKEWGPRTNEHSV